MDHSRILSGLAAIVWLLVPLTGRAADETPLDQLGDYERRAVAKVLKQNGWSIDPDPDALEIGEVHIATLPVFSEEDGDALEWFNNLHTTSKPEVIRRDVLLETGEAWNDEDARETERNLREATYPVLALAVVVPLETDDPDTVDVLVVTRDLWSLRPSTNFEYQSGTLASLFFSVSENNLLGRHKAPGAFFDMDLGSFGFGPRYYDPNVFGSHVRFFSRGRAIFGRRSGEFEGSRSLTQIIYPLWNLERTWGGDLSVSHSDEIIRQFRGSDLLQYDNPATPVTETAPYKYRLRDFRADAHLRYGTGQTVEHRLSAGYRFVLRKAELTPDFPTDGTLRRGFRDDVLPPPERNSGPVFGYSLFVPKWQTYRSIDSFELPEEKRLGPYVQAEISPVLEPLGSLETFVGASATVGGRVDLWDSGFALAEGSASTRLQREEWIDNLLTGLVLVASPPAFDLMRMVVRSRADRLIDDTQNRILFAGGRTGLRGYRIGAFAGKSRLVTNVEVRPLPISIWTTRLGAVAFWDLGHAADEPRELALRHDVGFGLRLLVPQANTLPLRADWAFPLAAGRPTGPGRLSVGFDQAF